MIGANLEFRAISADCIPSAAAGLDIPNRGSSTSTPSTTILCPLSQKENTQTAVVDATKADLKMRDDLKTFYSGSPR